MGITIALAQRKELALMPGEDARKAHAELDAMIREALKTWKYDSLILAEAGYHFKNAYLLKHWQAYQAGGPPQDPLLTRAEARFFETLFVNPEDPSALNRLGGILSLEREPYAAEFFIPARARNHSTYEPALSESRARPRLSAALSPGTRANSGNQGVAPSKLPSPITPFRCGIN
jgi:hypothetical protein